MVQRVANCFCLLPVRIRQWHSTPDSCLENPMNGVAWQAAVHGVAESQKALSYFTFTFHFHSLEKEMATHSTLLAWIIRGTGEPGGLLLWDRTESDTIEVTQQQQQVFIAVQDFSIFSEQGPLCNFSALAFQSYASLDVNHRLQGIQAQQLWPTSLVALGHLQSSQTRS